MNLAKKLFCLYLMTLVMIFPNLSFGKEYSIEEIVTLSKTQNYQVRKDFEKLYQSRHDINRKIGILLPHFNFGTASSMFSGSTLKSFGLLVLSPLQLVGNFVGFIFPSNWYSLKESKFYFEADKRFFSSAIANQVNGVENLAIKLNQSASLLRIYEENMESSQHLVDVLRERARLGIEDPTGIIKTEMLASQMKNDYLLLKEIYSFESRELAQLVGLASDELKNFRLRPIALPTMDNLEPIDSETFYAKVLGRSVELVGLKYLHLSSKYSTRKRAWNFLTPSSDGEGSMGFGYGSNIQIGRSQTREVEILIDEANGKLADSLISSVEQYNDSLLIYEEQKTKLSNAKKLLSILKNKFELNGNIDMNDLTFATQEYIRSLVDVINTKHMFLSATANINRQLWQGQSYKGILPKIYLNPPKEKLTPEQKHENRLINRAIRRGEITLPVDTVMLD